MRIFPANLKSNSQKTGIFRTGLYDFIRNLFFVALSLSITFSNYAQEDDSDFLEKVLEDKPKKQETKKPGTQTPAQVNANAKDKKKKLGKVVKKNPKTLAKVDPNKKPKPINPDAAKTTSTQSLGNNKLNLEYWIHEELTMNPKNIPGFEEPKVADNTNPTNIVPVNNPDKPVEKKPVDKPVENSKPNVIFTFLNEYKKIIFIFAAIIIFAIYRLRYAGSRNYNNSGRIFSKFRNK